MANWRHIVLRLTALCSAAGGVHITAISDVKGRLTTLLQLTEPDGQQRRLGCCLVVLTSIVRIEQTEQHVGSYQGTPDCIQLLSAADDGAEVTFIITLACDAARTVITAYVPDQLLSGHDSHQWSI